MSLRNTLLLSSERATVSAVAAALESNGKLSNDNVCGDLAQLAERLKAKATPAVLVDIDGQPERMLFAMEPLVRKFSDTKFVVLSGVMRNDLLLGAMQVGARHFMLKESVPVELVGVLHRLCPEALAKGYGAAVTVLSAGGGCGATTVAVNLAAELRLAHSDSESFPALVVDLDPCYGAVSAYLGIDNEYGIVDILSRLGPIDAELIQSTAVAQSEGLHALLGTSREKLGDPMAFDPQRLKSAVESCKKSYHWTVFDAARVPVAASIELARQSVATLLLLQLSVKDLRVARQVLHRLAAEGIAMEDVKILACRYRKRGGLISIDQAREALGVSNGSLATLANDYQAVVQAVNLGKPLSEVAPRCDFRRDLQKLAASISAARRQGKAGAHPSQ